MYTPVHVAVFSILKSSSNSAGWRVDPSDKLAPPLDLSQWPRETAASWQKHEDENDSIWNILRYCNKTNSTFIIHASCFFSFPYCRLKSMLL